jgi:hypothetical protein
MVEFAQRRMVQQGLDPSTRRSRGTGITSGLMPEGSTFFQQVPFDPKKFDYVPNVREPVPFVDTERELGNPFLDPIIVDGVPSRRRSESFKQFMDTLDREERAPQNETPEQMQERMLIERQTVLDSSPPLSPRQAENEEQRLMREINRMLEERQRLLDSSPPMSPRRAEDEEGITSLLRDSMGGQMPSNLEAGIMATGQAIRQLNRNLDNAKDLPDVMDAIRGDRKTIAERKDELAGLVGTEDAQKTPDSVLAVMQPFFQILDVVQAQASPGGIADLPMDEPKGAR